MTNRTIEHHHFLREKTNTISMVIFHSYDVELPEGKWMVYIVVFEASPFMIGLWKNWVHPPSHDKFLRATRCPRWSEETPPLRTDASGLFASTNSPQPEELNFGLVELNWGWRNCPEDILISKQYRLQHYKEIVSHVCGSHVWALVCRFFNCVRSIQSICFPFWRHYGRTATSVIKMIICRF